MVVLNKDTFRLPRMERDKFISLMRLGLNYDRARGTFSVANCNNIETLIDTLSEILKDEVSFLQNCNICHKDFSCQDCKYYDMCTTKNVPSQCICQTCLREEKTTRQQQTLF